MTPAKAAAYYEQNYPDYEAQNPAHKLGFYRDLLRARVAPGARVFELGVGQGLFLDAVKDEFRVAGCDINSFGVEQTRKRTGLDTISVGSSESVALSGPYDAVVSWDVLEHLPQLSRGLEEIRAGLKPGGVLIAVVPVYDGPLGWLVRLLDKDPTHVTQESRGFWLKTLSEAGFEVVEWGGILRKLVGKRYVHLTRPQPLLRPTGSAMHFVARTRT